MHNPVSLIERLRDVTLSNGEEVYSSEDGTYRELKSGRITVQYYPGRRFDSSGGLSIDGTFPYSVVVYRSRLLLPSVLLLEANGIKVLFEKAGWQEEVKRILE